MVFWRKKNDGFEWHRYVRTTKLIRRKERREKLEEAGAAAVFGVKRAGWYSWESLLAGSRKAASGTVRAIVWAARQTRYFAAYTGKTLLAALHLAWLWLRHGAKRAGHYGGRAAHRGAQVGGEALQAAGNKARNVVQHRLAPTAKRAGASAAQKLRPVRHRLSKPELTLPLVIVAAISGFGFAGQWITKGFTAEAAFAGLVCLITTALLWLAHGPVRRRYLTLRFPNLAVPRAAVWSAAAAAVIAAGLFTAPMALNGLKKMPSFAKLELPHFPITTGTLLQRPTVAGRAKVLSGDRMKIKTTVVRLDGIEAPLPAQTCTNSRSRKWTCGQQARAALARLVRRKALTCEIVSNDGDGTAHGRCKAGDIDLAEAVVRKGYAFAEAGFFSRYAEAEQDAKSAKRGIWKGEALRPQDYRDRLWQTAADKAPGGCPIKAMKRRGRQLYALPWDRAYSRITTRKRHGGRWFCSEDEAVSAGYKRAS